MTRRKIKRRKVKQVNSSSQMSLGLAGQPAIPKSTAANMAVEGNELLFNDPSPDKLFVGGAPLSDFLQEAGFGYIFSVRTLIRQLDLSAVLAGYKPGGRPPYHPASLIGLILHGIMEGRTSLRELETLGRSDVRSWWLTGGVMPSYSIIGRFICKNEAFLTESFFERLTGEILRKTQSQSSSVAVDGTVIQAAASRYRTIRLEAAEEAAKEARRKATETPDNAKLAQKAAHAEGVEDEDEPREAIREVMAQPRARQRYRKRQAMVEPVFPVLKYQQNLLRFRRRGQSAVSLEFSLQCAAYNIRRYLLLSGILATVRQLAAVWTPIMAIGAIARLCGLLKQQRRIKIPQTVGRCPLCQRGI